MDQGVAEVAPMEMGQAVDGEPTHVFTAGASDGVFTKSNGGGVHGATTTRLQ